MDVHTIEPMSFLNNEDESIALIKLNTPVSSHVESFRKLWKKAKLRALVDGAVNDLDAYRLGIEPEFVPDIVTGDFDSARPELLQNYREKGVEIINTPDQNQTDFTKCLKIVIDRISTDNLKVASIVAFVSFSGRLDHVLGNMNTLYLCQELTRIPVYLYSGDGIACLLSSGRHKLEVGYAFRENVYRTCGLIPLGSSAHSVTTTGLKWNMSNAVLEFGGIVSTSNKIESETVTVDTDTRLLWVMAGKELT